MFTFNYIPTGIGCNQNSHLLRVHHAFVNTLDLDGDGLAEVQVNLRVFDDWTNPNGPWTQIYELPREEFLDEAGGQTRGGNVGRATADMVTGDVTGDGRDDIVTFVQWRAGVTVWGLDGPSLESAQWKQIIKVPTRQYDSQSRVFPIVLPISDRIVDIARTLLDRHDDLMARDALHAAVVLHHDLEAICSFDTDFDAIEGIRRIAPQSSPS